MTTIGILGSQYLSTPELPFHQFPVTYTRTAFINALQSVGGTVIMIPIDRDLDKLADYIKLVDKVMLTGGEDVAPLFYGQDPHPLLGNINPERDRFEIAAIHEVIKQEKALLGVCRGHQLLNVALGGTLYQDVSLYRNPEVATLKHMQAPTKFKFTTHFVNVDPTSSLNFLPETYHVNSYHHQMIDQLADDLITIATASDGVIEAVENKAKRLLGVQWHPEGTWDNIPDERAIFDFFVNQL
ncbi:putative glutamine amidotransferase [Lactococcus chungangensis CAU 28 = DSM 22330]|uniref:Putative glutamine amidotransferase n=1 Tax=Pseudolactococcus chungangensis CAU 28 = DSM 22330 TaxID=1122154 RepID=A0A1K2H6I2_9LACT|nr:gamma-glutamyl-gamma-aminobutyrate hydrolase family protein [Lactococcus chungangensis]NCB82047.1 gamma-glutamyl-gamma-aminobutyrate hydrolase family protein [Bacilli bacterium]SFZ71333.1 putative glutamine amidotransferase [Lactococcus chungangensis CAU 28 = DSM 22330]